jgi:diacylglycerol kinase (ATP)
VPVASPTCANSSPTPCPTGVEAFTTGPGQEAALVDRALAEGHDAIVAIGGDGTWSLVADRLLRAGRRDVRLGLLPAGTGNDFGKSLGVTFDRAEQAVRAIAEHRTRRVDVGRAGDRHFLNVVGAGFDIAVIDDAAHFPLLRGDALYQFCALRQLFRFPGLTLEIAANGAAPSALDHLMLVVANANYFGGSFHIAPRARLDDGRLDVVSIANAGAFERARLFSLVGKGRHEGHPKVVVRQAARLRVQAAPGWRYEMDGEVYTCEGAALDIESVPAALEVFVPES